MHLGCEYAENKDGFKCVSKKNIVPRGHKLKWLAAMDPQKFPTSDLVQYWGIWECWGGMPLFLFVVPVGAPVSTHTQL